MRQPLSYYIGLSPAVDGSDLSNAFLALDGFAKFYAKNSPHSHIYQINGLLSRTRRKGLELSI